MLPIPVLDDERFREIAEHARSMIPKICPEWTDFNYHDPGITFLELFAFLKESQQYHMDQIGPANRSKFLKLLNMQRQERSPARMGVALWGGPETGALRRGSRVLAGEIPFEVCRTTPVTERLRDGFGWDGSHRNGFTADRAEGGRLHVELLGADPAPGNACYFRFPEELLDTTAVYLWMAGHAPVERNPIGSFDFTPLAELEWELLTAEGWKKAPVLSDTTHGLLFSGEVLLDTGGSCPWEEAPAEERQFLESPGRWLRVRMVSGSWDVAPVLTGVTDVMVPAVQQETRAACLELAPAGREVREDSLLAAWGSYAVYRKTEDGFWTEMDGVERRREKATTVFTLPRDEETVLLTLWRPEFSPHRSPGVGDGFPNQQLRLEEAGQLRSGFTLLAEEEATGRYSIWQQVEDFDASSPEDRHYVLDSETGTLTFGDCIHGLAPEGRLLIIADAVTTGSGGNVKAGRVDRIHPEDLAGSGLGGSHIFMRNPDDARGGQERETDEHMFARCRKLLRQTDRAVTYADHERLVRSTPGLMISNCKAVPVTRLPRQDGSLEENCVTIVVEPCSDHRERTLSPAYVTNIRRYLETRRMLGTRIALQAPEYIKLTIYAEIVSEPHYVDAKLRIREAVENFFGRGWEFGSPVRYSELYGSIDTLDCVRRIDALTIDAQGRGISRSLNGDVLLPYNGLAVLKQTGLQVRPGE